MDDAAYLSRALRSHNPWWDSPEAAFADLPATKKSAFYRYAGVHRDAEGVFTRAQITGLVGPLGVGKTTILKQFIQYTIEERDLPPDHVLYIPFSDEPVYHLQAARQLRQAVEYYETRVLGTDPDDMGEHYVILDDVHALTDPQAPSGQSWGTAVVDLLEDRPNRRVLLSGTTAAQVEAELTPVTDGIEWTTRVVLGETFRGFIETLFPDLGTGQARLNLTPLRTGESGLPAVCRNGDPAPLFETLGDRFEQMRPQRNRIRSKVSPYLALGGVLGLQAAALDDIADLPAERHHRHRMNLQLSIYREAPGVATLQAPRDLERLCDLAARAGVRSPIQYRWLTDLFEVTRRTLRESYFAALSDLLVLRPAEEYDNSKPRTVRLYLRDTGYVNLFGGHSPHDVVMDLDHEAECAQVAAFDHTMRLAVSTNAAAARADDTVADAETSAVSFWQGDAAEVDFVFECVERPIPIALAYSPGSVEAKTAAVQEFRDAYDAPLGLVVTGDMVETDEAFELMADDRIVRLPYWFYLLIC